MVVIKTISEVFLASEFVVSKKPNKVELFLFAYFSPYLLIKFCGVWFARSAESLDVPYTHQLPTYFVWQSRAICRVILSMTYSSELFAFCVVNVAGFYSGAFILVVCFATCVVSSLRCFVVALVASDTRLAETVSGTLCLAMVVVLVRTYKMRYSPDVCCWSLLYVLRTEASADDVDVVAQSKIFLRRSYRPVVRVSCALGGLCWTCTVPGFLHMLFGFESMRC